MPKLNPMQEARRLAEEIWKDTRLWDTNLSQAQSLIEDALRADPEDTVLLTGLGTVLDVFRPARILRPSQVPQNVR